MLGLRGVTSAEGHFTSDGFGMGRRNHDGASRGRTRGGMSGGGGMSSNNLRGGGMSSGMSSGMGGGVRRSGGGLHRISRISTAPVKRRKRFQDIFELGSVVGRGAMCAVHRCHLRVSGEIFAVKVFSMRGSEEQHSVLQQLAAEISTHRLLSHPNIVCLRACFQEPEAMCVLFWMCWTYVFFFPCYLHDADTILSFSLSLSFYVVLSLSLSLCLSVFQVCRHGVFGRR